MPETLTLKDGYAYWWPEGPISMVAALRLHIWLTQFNLAQWGRAIILLPVLFWRRLCIIFTLARVVS